MMKTPFGLHNLFYTRVLALPRRLSMSRLVVVAFVKCWSPSTNTLLLPYGELSISLWDLYKLGGLPVAGHLMDEVVSSTKCISPPLTKKERVPESCRFLLHAYHCLTTSSSNRFVCPAEWIDFGVHCLEVILVPRLRSVAEQVLRPCLAIHVGPFLLMGHVAL
ncbi:hypothetical protein LIER_18961 [Lithospermum erythrorhizon]|uniref:Secreted protein n=1 Tax=Lithospermum erythrorhizon TaxID=34254 RepID=A0AAV3QFY8_LITER